MNTKIAYIAGQIDYVNSADFYCKEAELKAVGYGVINPAMLPEGLTHRQYKSICVPMLLCCDEIHMLDGWERSASATTEYRLAVELGIEVIM